MFEWQIWSDDSSYVSVIGDLGRKRLGWIVDGVLPATLEIEPGSHAVNRHSVVLTTLCLWRKMSKIKSFREPCTSTAFSSSMPHACGRSTSCTCASNYVQPPQQHQRRTRWWCIQHDERDKKWWQWWSCQTHRRQTRNNASEKVSIAYNQRDANFRFQSILLSK